MSPNPWTQTSERLASKLGSLGQDDTLVLAEVPQQPTQARGGLFRRARPTPVRYVQFRRDGEMITGECVGATSWGGYYDIDADTDGRLRELGWLAPEQVPQALRDSPNYRVDAPRADAARLATMAVGALAVLGLSPDAELDWQEH
ncbi:MAG TPA: hypothetical protein VHO29_15025 [Marmoricola sp.]|nr:hypothetical protein [Marmoricola sp.]